MCTVALSQAHIVEECSGTAPSSSSPPPARTPRPSSRPRPWSGVLSSQKYYLVSFYVGVYIVLSLFACTLENKKEMCSNSLHLMSGSLNDASAHHHHVDFLFL